MATPSRRAAISRPHPAKAAADAAKAAVAEQDASAKAPSTTPPTSAAAQAPAPSLPELAVGQLQATRDHDTAAPASRPTEAGERPSDDPAHTAAGQDTDGPESSSPSSAGTTPRLVSGRVSFAGRATTVYFGSPEERDRVKAAFRARGGADGYGSETDWYRDLILLATETWEREHNNGQPFQLRRRARR